jgi:hypothetical protein
MSGGFQAFAWRGEPIPDIRAWARSRGEQMVRYDECRSALVLVGCMCFAHGEPDDDDEIEICQGVYEPIIEKTPGIMPASFWGTMRVTGESWFVETSREDA